MPAPSQGNSPAFSEKTSRSSEEVSLLVLRAESIFIMIEWSKP